MANPGQELRSYHRGIRITLSVFLRAVDMLDMQPDQAMTLLREFNNAVIGQGPAVRPFLDTAIAKAFAKLGFSPTPEQLAAIFPASAVNEQEPDAQQAPATAAPQETALDRIKRRLRRLDQPQTGQTEPAAL